jgi:hypothetical protein
MPLDVVSGAIAVTFLALVIYTLSFSSKKFLFVRKWVSGQSTEHSQKLGPKDTGPNAGRPWGSKLSLQCQDADDV